MVDKELQLLAEGYLFLYIGLIGFAFAAYVGIIPAYAGFGGYIVYGLYRLIKTFIIYQWPNRREYMDFWRMHWTR